MLWYCSVAHARNYSPIERELRPLLTTFIFNISSYRRENFVTQSEVSLLFVSLCARSMEVNIENPGAMQCTCFPDSTLASVYNSCRPWTVNCYVRAFQQSVRMLWEGQLRTAVFSYRCHLVASALIEKLIISYKLFYNGTFYIWFLQNTISVIMIML